jgi:hypothetical protein
MDTVVGIKGFSEANCEKHFSSGEGIQEAGDWQIRLLLGSQSSLQDSVPNRCYGYCYLTGNNRRQASSSSVVEHEKTHYDVVSIL